MYKIFLTLIFVSALNAEIAGGISVVVKGYAITLYDIKKEMEFSKVDAKKASDNLIRKKLEELEITERKIEVENSEIYEDIKNTAQRNNMSVDEFYVAVRNANGLSSSELKDKIREKLLSQKLYSAIAYSHVSEPSESEIKDYYELHKEAFSHPSAFNVIIYQSADKEKLQEKIDNPMFYSPEIVANEQLLAYDRISPELASLLEKTPLDKFTPIVPDGKGGSMSFYIKEIKTAAQGGIDSIKAQIINMIMAEKREMVLGDYFARLRDNADIQTIRMPQ